MHTFQANTIFMLVYRNMGPVYRVYCRQVRVTSLGDPGTIGTATPGTQLKNEQQSRDGLLGGSGAFVLSLFFVSGFIRGFDAFVLCCCFGGGSITGHGCFCFECCLYWIFSHDLSRSHVILQNIVLLWRWSFSVFSKCFYNGRSQCRQILFKYWFIYLYCSWQP